MTCIGMCQHPEFHQYPPRYTQCAQVYLEPPSSFLSSAVAIVATTNLAAFNETAFNAVVFDASVQQSGTDRYTVETETGELCTGCSNRYQKGRSCITFSIRTVFRGQCRTPKEARAEQQKAWKTKSLERGRDKKGVRARTRERERERERRKRGRPAAMGTGGSMNP